MTRSVPLSQYKPCKHCGAALTPQGGRCPACVKAARKGWKRDSRARMANNATDTETTQPTPDILADSGTITQKGWKRHGLTPAIVAVIKGVYERSDAFRRAEIRALNPDVEFE